MHGITAAEASKRVWFRMGGIDKVKMPCRIKCATSHPRRQGYACVGISRHSLCDSPDRLDKD